jgi:hypothetical protein
MNKCYMCDADGVTKEHAPPYSFFPIGIGTICGQYLHVMNTIPRILWTLNTSETSLPLTWLPKAQPEFNFKIKC